MMTMRRRSDRIGGEERRDNAGLRVSGEVKPCLSPSLAEKHAILLGQARSEVAALELVHQLQASGKFGRWRSDGR